MSQSVLVLGASGYIGQHLVRELSARGYPVLAAARHIDRLQKLDLPGVTCRSVDLNQPQALPALLAGIDTLYYLVHGMGEGGDFIAHERRVATHVRDALRQSSVRQVIFLSSLQAPAQEQSDHLRARQVTGEVLRESGVPVTELRAGIIVGAGSAAFEVMRDMVYNLPVLTPPRWVRSRTTPVALENLLVDLVELLNHPSNAHRVFEAAGPEVLSYQQQFIHFMAVSGRHRPLIPIPLPTRWISVWFLNVITSVPPTIARALIQGLKHDLIADDRALRALIPQTLIPFDQAVRRQRHLVSIASEQRDYLQTGDTVGSWKVIIVEEEKQLTLLFGMKAPGLGRLSFTINDKGDHRELDVRAWWHPHGMPGLIYWLLMIPAHLFIFRGMAQRIARLAEQISGRDQG